MKTEISRDSHQPNKRYSGVYQQQGRMLADADWNELVDILKGRLNDALKDIIGCREGGIGGVPRHRALQVIKGALADQLTIRPGQVYIDGMAAQVPGDTTIDYTLQPDFPTPPVLIDDCVLYADVWERTVTQLTDARLRDQGLHGADTCTRQEVMAQIKWCPVGVEPEVAAENPYKGNARATITLLKKSDHPDLCDPCVEELELESRVGNYLFRLEVHDVKGPADKPSEITFKWSTENGAIQCGLVDAEPPEYFTAGDWAFEYFDETSEKHLGVHLVGDWSPVRGILQNTYDKPGEGKPNEFVRRWNGYCTVKKNGTWSASERYDKDFKDTLVVEIGVNAFTIKLNAQTIVITLGQTIVAGDFWLADVREAEHADGEALLTAALPCGVDHRYLKLGQVVGGVLQDNPEAARKYAFPPLTEMTRMFIAGGDGQEVVPGDPLNPLPQPLRVAVANGEWPVKGAKVRFHTKTGSLVPGGIVTSADDGIAECIWTPDGVAIDPDTGKPKYEVTVTLVDPDNETKDLTHPPVYFYANLITADQVAYVPPDCQPETINPTTVHHLLGPDIGALGTDGYYTVKEVLDALLCKFKADHLPYDEPACTDTDVPSVKSLLVEGNVYIVGNDDLLTVDGHLTVKYVLDTLLCKLKANHIPFYPVNCAAADLAPTVKTGLGINANTNVHEVLQKLICKLDASKVPYNPNASPNTIVRWRDIKEESGSGGLSAPNTVQDAIDALLAWLESTDINYLVPECTTPSVRSLLMGDWVAAEKPQKIDAVLTRLLCDFKASHLPVDRDNLCPKLAGLSGAEKVETVQDAINGLCQMNHAGGCCTITILPGDDLAARLTGEIAIGADAHICITAGEYMVKEPVILEGRGNITLQGCGDGSFIRSPNSESAVIISNCKSVVVRNLRMQSHSLGNGKESGSEHLNGVLTVQEVGVVVVEDVTLTCAHGGQRMASCLTVAHGTAIASVRVRACRLNPGHQQVGILLVNAALARIENNEVSVRPQNKKSSLMKRLNDLGYRLTIRKMMLSDVIVVDGKTPADKQRNVQFAYEGRLLRFNTDPRLSRIWPEYLAELVLEKTLQDRDLIRYLKDKADSILLLLASGETDAAIGLAGFKPWFNRIKAHLPAIASQGIVVAGRIANDICITKNSIHGVAQGIHIGLSHSDPEIKEPDIAGRVLIDGNHIVNYLSAQALGEWHGLFVGNFACLHVENNHLELNKYPYNLEGSMNGVRVFGYFGPMLQVRGNCLNGYNPGIFAKALSTAENETCLWQVENNLLGGASVGPVLAPPPKFITSNNLY